MKMMELGECLHLLWGPYSRKKAATIGRTKFWLKPEVEKEVQKSKELGLSNRASERIMGIDKE